MTRHCIELIDVESKLRDFWRDHLHPFDDVRAIFLPCEAFLPAASA